MVYDYARSSSGTRRTLLSTLAAYDITLVVMKIILELGNAESIVAAVVAGIGVSFVSRVSAAFAIKAGDVCEMPVHSFNFHRKTCMTRDSLQSTSRPAELYWGFIHDPENADLFQKISRKKTREQKLAPWFSNHLTL